MLTHHYSGNLLHVYHVVVFATISYCEFVFASRSRDVLFCTHQFSGYVLETNNTRLGRWFYQKLSGQKVRFVRFGANSSEEQIQDKIRQILAYDMKKIKNNIS